MIFCCRRTSDPSPALRMTISFQPITHPPPRLLSPPRFSAKLSGHSWRLMEREFSAGGVVLRKMRGRWFLAVIEPHMDRPRKPAKKFMAAGANDPHSITALPKGAIDEGEKPEQTALREVKEETGLTAELIQSSPTSSMSTSAIGAITRVSSKSSASTFCSIALASSTTSPPRCAWK